MPFKDKKTRAAYMREYRAKQAAQQDAQPEGGPEAEEVPVQAQDAPSAAQGKTTEETKDVTLPQDETGASDKEQDENTNESEVTPMATATMEAEAKKPNQVQAEIEELRLRIEAAKEARANAQRDLEIAKSVQKDRKRAALQNGGLKIEEREKLREKVESAYSAVVEAESDLSILEEVLEGKCQEGLAAEKEALFAELAKFKKRTVAAIPAVDEAAAALEKAIAKVRQVFEGAQTARKRLGDVCVSLGLIERPGDVGLLIEEPFSVPDMSSLFYSDWRFGARDRNYTEFVAYGLDLLSKAEKEERARRDREKEIADAYRRKRQVEANLRRRQEAARERGVPIPEATEEEQAILDEKLPSFPETYRASEPRMGPHYVDESGKPLHQGPR